MEQWIWSEAGTAHGRPTMKQAYPEKQQPMGWTRVEDKEKNEEIGVLEELLQTTHQCVMNYALCIISFNFVIPILNSFYADVIV